jgi:ribosomal protein S12 methylthiotransferase accessory factor YcaO
MTSATRLTIGNDAPHGISRPVRENVSRATRLLEEDRHPTVAAAADDTVTRDPAMIVIGSGTHAGPEIAALRA